MLGVGGLTRNAYNANYVIRGGRRGGEQEENADVKDLNSYPPANCMQICYLRPWPLKQK